MRDDPDFTCTSTLHAPAEPGAWMPEQVIDPAGFFSRLAERGVNVALAPGADNVS